MVAKNYFMCNNNSVRTKGDTKMNTVIRFMIYDNNNLNIQGFETEKEALERYEFMKGYHQRNFYVKKFEYVCVNGEWVNKELVA